MIRKLMGIFNLKPKYASKSVVKQQQTNEDVVTVINPSGKEVLIVTSQLANHLDRGFTLKG